MKTPERKCGECTACCEGWLHGEAHGHAFWPGRPCHYLSPCKGCSIYPNRPKSPCVDFKCVWLSEDILPMWFRPDQCNVIVTREKWGPNKEFTYLKIHERGKKIDATVLNVLYMLQAQKQLPIAIQIDGGWNFFGPQAFLDDITKS